MPSKMSGRSDRRDGDYADPPKLRRLDLASCAEHGHEPAAIGADRDADA